MNKNYNESELINRAKECILGNVYSFNGCNLICPSNKSYKGVWNWDSAFIALAVYEWDKDLALEQIDFFFDRQDKRGMLYDAYLANGTVYTEISKPPVFAWVISLLMERYGCRELATKYYDKLVKNEHFWTTYRLLDGLFHYDAFLDGEWDEKYARNESGWDNSVRWDNGSHNLYSIDLNCYMIMFYNSLISLSKVLNNGEDNIWQEKKSELIKQINNRLWNNKVQSYTDYDFERKEFSNILTPASFMPLFVGITPKDKAELMYNLAKSDKFYPLFPTVSYDDKKYNCSDYWRGPTWLNVSYFAIKGLYDYGYKDIAYEFRNNILEMCEREKEGIFEYYDSKTGKGIGAEQFGWSATFIIEFIKNIK